MGKGSLRQYRRAGSLTDRQIARIAAHLQAMGITASKAQEIADEAGRSFHAYNPAVLGWAEYEASQGQD